MKKTLFAIALVSLSLAACKKDRVANKIIDGVPLHVEETVLPAHALQQYMLYKRDSLRVIMIILNKTSISDSIFPELTSPPYQFTVSERHYGSVTVTLQFYDGSGNAIDPIAAPSSTSTLKSVSISAATNGSNGLFTFTEAGGVVLSIQGDVTSPVHSTGTITFSGSGYAPLTFSLTSPGARTAIEGFREGNLTATGSGPNGSTPSLTLTLGNDHSASGAISWEGQQGSVFVGSNGLGFVVTNQARIPIE